MRILVAAATLLAAALAATAAAHGAPGRTAEDWGTKADRICTRIQAEIDAIPAPSKLEDFPASLQRLLAEGRKEHRLLSALPRPAARKARIAEYLATYPPLFGLVERMIAAARRGDQKAYGALLARGEPLGKHAKKLAAALRATSCAE